MSTKKEETHFIAKKYGWEIGKDYPEWGNNLSYLQTITGGYLLKGETPNMAYERLAEVMKLQFQEDDPIIEEVETYLKKGWLIPSTPVLANLGTERGLPISCNAGHIGDSMGDIGRKNLEMMMLSKYGAGTAYDFSSIRPIGSPIKEGKNGTSDGVIPFMKMFDSAIIASKQSSMRRGATALYLDGNHQEFESFLNVRKPSGDINRQCLNIHQGAIFDDEFMNKVVNNPGSKERSLWTETLKTRVKTGEPYTMFIDNANKAVPEYWKEQGLKVRHSNLCAEIMLPTDGDHTLVCCLSHINLAKFEEFRDDKTFEKLVKAAIYFLDCVIEEYLMKATTIYEMRDAVRFASKSRALGLGVVGWHTLLQSKNLPFAGIRSNALTRYIFNNIRKYSEIATKELADILGEPLWCIGQKRRNLTLLAVAPNKTSSLMAPTLEGSCPVSQGIEPIAANIYINDSAKGLVINRNAYLEQLLEKKERNISQVWEQIDADKGSVKNIRCLSKEEKEVFLTFREINQLEIVKQAAIRQDYIDQGVSLNLAFFGDAPARWINKVHIEAWKSGIKSLYYLRSESKVKADTNQQRDLYSECVACAS